MGVGGEKKRRPHAPQETQDNTYEPSIKLNHPSEAGYDCRGERATEENFADMRTCGRAKTAGKERKGREGSTAVGKDRQKANRAGEDK